MEYMERLVKLQLAVSSVENEKIQSLIFLLQEFGEPLGYSFDIHHFQVFSDTLANDLKQPLTRHAGKSTEVSNFVIEQISSAPVDHVNAAATHLFFLRKGYSDLAVEESLALSSEVAAGSKQLLAVLRNSNAKQLASSVR